MTAPIRLEYPLSGKVLESATRCLDEGIEYPVEPRFAATVLLVRDAIASQSGVEVFMLKRAKSMAFVPDALVFPGGRVDESDQDTSFEWVGPSAQEWAVWMNCSNEIAAQVVVAAARELFEECGVLLAGSPDGSIVNDLHNPTWNNERELLSSHKQSFGEMLAKYHMQLRSDLLALRSHWVTPIFEPRRYNTYFFVALLPQGQLPDGNTSEAVSAEWREPGATLEAADQEQVILMPPTRYNIESLLHAKSAEEFVSERVPIPEIMLQPDRTEQGEVVLTCMVP